MADLLGENDSLVQKDKLYRFLDRIVEHKLDFFTYLNNRWHSLFTVKYDVLLYDLISTYFECNPPGVGKRQFGYSRFSR